jgi:intraflagellar transport protein 122
VNAITFSPDGLHIIVAAGSRVYMFDAVVSELLKKLKAHKDEVYCLAYSKDGKRFASGSLDTKCIVWNSEGEGLLKISHTNSIQCLAFNPVSHELACCSQGEYSIWSPDSNDVGKIKVTSKILCCSWTNDGQHLALGHFDGKISIRNKLNKEVMVIQRKAPIWCMSWNPSREEQHDILAVGCWDQTLSFYHFPSGKQLKKDKQLGYDPCTLTFFSNGEYMCLGGSDRKVSLWTKDGIKLMTIAECEDWVWTVAHRPHQNFIVCIY